MTVDPINKQEKLFPSYSGGNDSLLSHLNKTSQILCKWFSDSEKLEMFNGTASRVYNL